MIAVVITLLLTCVFLLYLYATRNFYYWKTKDVAFIKPIPIFGNIFKVITLQTPIGEFMRTLYNSTEKPYLGYFAFNKPILLVRDPELIKLILVKDFEYFSDRYVGRNEKDDNIGASFLFILRNPKWRAIRKDVGSLYNSGMVKKVIPTLVEVSNKLLEYVDELMSLQKPIDIRELSIMYTTEAVVSTAYGVTSVRFDTSEFRAFSKRIFNWNSLITAIHFNFYFASPHLVKMFKMKFVESGSSKFLQKLVSTIITERISSKRYRGDVIDHLMQIKEKYMGTISNWDDNMIVSHAILFFFSSFETNGSTLSYALYELSLNQSIQHKLRKELISLYEKYKEISYEMLQESHYLHMVVYETLRKYPVLPFLSRYCTTPYNVPNTDLTIEKGTPVYFSLLGLQHDPLYFPNPEKFIPERFSLENKSLRPTACYLPLGDGPRACMGKQLAITTVKIAIIKFLLQYEVLPSEKTPVAIQFDRKGILLTPTKNLYLTLKHLN